MLLYFRLVYAKRLSKTHKKAAFFERWMCYNKLHIKKEVLNILLLYLRLVYAKRYPKHKKGAFFEFNDI